MVNLFRKHVNGIGTWRIWAESNVLHIAHATVIGGSEVRHTETVETNQSGRTMAEQIQLRIKSRVSRMMDKGYKATVDEAMSSSSSNQLGLLRPMLAKQIAKVSRINYDNAVTQKKLDGHRCMINMGDDIYAYSRQGKMIPAITHILPDLKKALPMDVTIDGELYIHGVPLQTLSSYIKKEQPGTYNLSFVAYDLVSDESYKDRHAELASILKHCANNPRIITLGYKPFESMAQTNADLADVRSKGFEGLMLKQDGFGYEVGVRSSGILKIKHFEDDEFKVVGFEKSSEGWAVCICETAEGKRFGCAAPGTKPEKHHVMNNQSDFLGKYLTIEFAYYTNDGIPFQPTAKCWYEVI